MIDTARLHLIPCSLPMLQALIADPMRIDTVFGYVPSAGWPEFPEGFSFVYDLVAAQPDQAAWWTYLFVRDSQIIGSGGYKGPPAGGMVEIGYEIAPAFRGQGYAAEAAQGLIDHAWTFPDVAMVDAHTLAEENASVHVLKRIGMQHIGTIDDPDDGSIWHWRLVRAR